jgi:glycosyltransferase involved in cell wall biosynthesis
MSASPDRPLLSGRAVHPPQLISIILTTYNQPEWLTKVLRGYASQTHANFEIVIADDGSDDRTTDAIDRIRNETKLKIEHVWHEDDGFRKCSILNQAITRAAGDYLLFSDGDCVPSKTFVANHYQFARPDTFLSGGYFKLPMSISHRLTIDDIHSGCAFQWRFLRKLGLPWSRHFFRFHAGKNLAALLNRITPTKPTWNGNNSSAWKKDVLAVNGFDERMKYGGLDREMGERLENAGVRGKHVRYNTLVLHLDHPRGYANEEDWARNAQIRQVVQEDRRTWTDYGIRKTLGDDTERLRRAA